MGAPGGLDRARRALALATAALCGALLLALTGVTVVDVVGRYLFDSPLPGAAEVTELLVMAIVFAGLPAVSLADGHVTVDLVTSRLGGRGAAACLAFGRSLAVLMLGIAAWRLWLQGERLGSWNEQTVYLGAPLEPVAKSAAVLCAVSALLVAAMAAARAAPERPPAVGDDDAARPAGSSA